MRVIGFKSFLERKGNISIINQLGNTVGIPSRDGSHGLVFYRDILFDDGLEVWHVRSAPVPVAELVAVKYLELLQCVLHLLAQCGDLGTGHRDRQDCVLALLDEDRDVVHRGPVGDLWDRPLADTVDLALDEGLDLCCARGRRAGRRLVRCGHRLWGRGRNR